MPLETKILPVDASKLGTVTISRSRPDTLLEDWDIEWAESSPDVARLRQAAAELRQGTLPVAFPTETVYGLGADATNSAAVRAIYTAKGRPSDNPLIVHVASLHQLRSLLQPNPAVSSPTTEPIPSIYHALIQRFWPGPLTLILPLPSRTALAPEVTAGLTTFGARMPGSIVALLLIKQAGRPVAAPSANASTKPSPTAAEHVAHDLAGRIATVLDGGPCPVGVESTVVDGISGPCPVILRPGGVSINQLRQCDGWEKVNVAYEDRAESRTGGLSSPPRAPGMKYRHYSPKARVVLFKAGTGVPAMDSIEKYKRVGAIRTKKWPTGCGFQQALQNEAMVDCSVVPVAHCMDRSLRRGFSLMFDAFTVRPVPTPQLTIVDDNSGREMWEVNLGAETSDIARGIFSALRDLDGKHVEVILVEGINEREGDMAAAVMNRLRKAAESETSGIVGPRDASSMQHSARC